MSNLLRLIAKNHPILRECMLDVENFNDSNLHTTITDMCYSILPEQLLTANCAHANAAGMAANQWGIRKRVFIFTPDGSAAGKRLEVMINPAYSPYLAENQTEVKLVNGYEGCFSTPLTAGIVNRYQAIVATYYTPAGEKIERIMQGFDARVFQHETDHLNGMLFDGRLDGYPGPECLERFIFKDVKDMDEFWVNTIRPSRGIVEY